MSAGTHRGCQHTCHNRGTFPVLHGTDESHLPVCREGDSRHAIHYFRRLQMYVPLLVGDIASV